MTTQQAAESGQIVVHTLRGEGVDASEDGTGRGTPLIPVAYGGNNQSGPIDIATACNAHGGTGRHDFESETFIAYQCHGSNVGPMGTLRAGNGNESGGVPFIHVPFNTTQITSRENRSNPNAGDPCHPLAATAHAPAIAYAIQERAVSENPDSGPGGKGWQEKIAYTLEARHHQQAVQHGRKRVRRLTPLECERLQGFRDDWTRFGSDGREISDSARYRMVGNSVAVPCVEWIAKRLIDKAMSQ